MCSHARRRPLTCKAVEKQKRVPNAIKNSSRLVTGAAASQIIHFLLAGLAGVLSLKSFYKVLRLVLFIESTLRFGLVLGGS